MQINPKKSRQSSGDETDPRLDVFDQAAWDASFDIDDFDDSDIDVPESVPNAASIFQEIQLSVEALAGTSSMAPDEADGNGFLFKEPVNPLIIQSKERRQSLWSVVVRAYQEIRSGRSVDYVVAEPDLNLLFLQRCWELGAAASPFELNWILMNARKDHRMPSVERAKPFSLDRQVVDVVSYAADIAMRELQDELYFAQQREMSSVDQVLCNPQLVRKFDAVASRICPGFRAFDYRWAVLSLRKARRNKPRVGFPTNLQELGLVEDVQRNRLPNSSGLYWITSGNKSVFVGVANNIQRQVLSLMERAGTELINAQDQSKNLAKPRLAVMDSPITWAEQYRTRVLADKGSVLNFQLSRSLLSAA